MATEKALRAAAKEMQNVMGLEPPINTKAPIDELTEQLKEAIDQIQDGDEFSETTQAVIDEFLEVEEEEEEVPAPKKAKKPAPPAPKKKAPVVEDEEEEEEEEEEEVVVPKKGVKKPVKKATVVEDDDDDEEEEEVPAPKKAKADGKKTPFVAAAVHRAETYALALAKNPKTLKQWAEMSNAIYVKNGGRDSMKQAEFDVQWLTKMFKHLDINIPTK